MPQGLAKSLRPRHLSMIALGGMIGAGLFVGSSVGIAQAGPAILLSYLAAGGVILLVMRMLAEMTVARPGLGAFSEYARLGLGNWAGFVSGWLYWFFWVVVVAVETIGAASVVHAMVDLPVWIVGLALLAAMTATNLWSARSYGEFEFWFSSIKVAAILAFILVVAGHLLLLPSFRERIPLNLLPGGRFAPFGAGSILTGVVTVIFSLVGAEIVTVAAAESAEPGRVIARMTTSLLLRVTLFYLASILLIVCTVPANRIVPGESPFVAALQAIGVPGAGTMMGFLVLVAVLSCLNSSIYVTSRTLFALAARGDAPAGLVALTGRQVPARAILLGTAFGYFSLLAAIVSPQAVFTFLINASSAVMLFIYLLLAAAEVKLRRQWERDEPERLQVRMWLFPWASYLTIAAMAAVLLAMACNARLASQLYLSLLSLGVALAAYAFRRTRHALDPKPPNPG